MIQKFILIFLFISTILPKLNAEEVIRGIRYLKPNASFSEVSDLYIQNKLISRIIESKQKDSVRYVLPSFCDAYVTLGSDGADGQNNLEGIKIALRSFLFHGFTHIQSVADGPWIYKIKSDIDSGKITGPKITIAERPMIPKSNEVKDMSDLLYFIADNKEKTLKEFEKQKQDSKKTIHIFNRYNEDSVFTFDSNLLNQMRLGAESKNKTLTIHTFTDRISILDALVSGNRYIAHPISSEIGNEITKQHKTELHMIPLLNVYRNLHRVGEEDDLLDFEELKNKSKFFFNNYSTFYESHLKQELNEDELENLKAGYSSYLEFIQANPILKGKMILGSGAGNRLSFPGVSGIQELKILAKALSVNESFFRIPTENSCSYLGGTYNGILAVGQEANLLVLKENPVKNLDTLFQIEQVFQFGKPVIFEPINKKLPKKR